MRAIHHVDGRPRIYRCGLGLCRVAPAPMVDAGLVPQVILSAGLPVLGDAKLELPFRKTASHRRLARRGRGGARLAHEGSINEADDVSDRGNPVLEVL